MGALTIASGLDLPIAAGSLQANVREIGNRVTAWDGTMRLNRRARKTDFSFETPPMSAADALAWEHLLAGTGQYWSFDADVYSSKGVAGTGTATYSTSNPKAGIGHLHCTGTQNFTGVIAPTPSNGLPVTISVWRRSGGVYSHHVIRSDGTKWVNGASSAAATTWLSISGSTSFTISDNGTDFDSLHACFGLWNQDMVTAVYAMAGASWHQAPALSLYGDALPGTSSGAGREYLAEVSGGPVLGGRLSGAAFSRALHSLSVTLYEI